MLDFKNPADVSLLFSLTLKIIYYKRYKDYFGFISPYIIWTYNVELIQSTFLIFYTEE